MRHYSQIIQNKIKKPKSILCATVKIFTVLAFLSSQNLFAENATKTTTNRKKVGLITKTTGQKKTTQKTKTTNTSQTKNTEQINNTLPSSLPPPESSVKLSNEVSLCYEQSAANPKDGSGKNKAWCLSYVPILKLGDFTLSSYLYYEKDLKNKDAKGQWDDTFLRLGYKGWDIIGENIKVSPFYKIEYPLSNESKFNRGIKYVNNVGMKFALNSKKLDIPSFNFSYALSGGYYQNEYTTRLNGDPQQEYKLTHEIKSSYEVSIVTFSLLFQFMNYFSYEGVERDAFLHGETISFKLTDFMSLGFYHYIKGPYLDPNSFDNNLKFYNPEKSMVGTSLDFSF